MILTLLKTIPSNSHNAPFSEEHGSHWPAGQRFRLLPPSRKRSIRAFYNHAFIRPGCTVVEQIGGEEVLVVIDNAKFEELFGITLEGTTHHVSNQS